MSAWDELLDEFRALGGTADNVRLDVGALGRGVFPIDPAKPVSLHVPENLLVDTGDMVFEDGALRVGAGAKAGTRERAWLDRYQAEFSWGGGGRAEIERIFEQAQALPAELRGRLATHYHCGSWFEDVSGGLIETQFLESRLSGYEGRDVIMPIVDLVNHGNGCAYRHARGISIGGTTDGEVTVHYADTDTYGLFRTWGFVCEEPVAFSVELTGSIGTARLFVERQTANTKTGERPALPTLTAGDGAMKLNFLMLGNRKLPRYCRGIFRRVFRDAVLADVDEPFDKLRQANQQHFLALLADLEPLDGPMVQTLRRMARLQLQTLTYCFGAREI